jgi:hypothetical protein
MNIANKLNYGLYYKVFSLFTFMLGLCLHITILLLNDKSLTLKYIGNLQVDIALSIPMLFATIFGLLSVKQMIFKNMGHKIISYVTIIYLSISAIVHFYTIFANKTEQVLSLFPYWYSYLFILQILIFSIGILLLKFKITSI